MSIGNGNPTQGTRGSNFAYERVISSQVTKSCELSRVDYNMTYCGKVVEKVKIGQEEITYIGYVLGGQVSPYGDETICAIQRVKKDLVTNEIDISWAGGGLEMDKEWGQRELYTYYSLTLK